ncbi:MAG: lipopolysaccharide kinase InaA family protein, partial [Tepidisphaeraceae bacterium]
MSKSSRSTIRPRKSGGGLTPVAFARGIVYSSVVTGNELESTLRNLTSVGALIKDKGYRQVWRFEHAGKPYYLKFYPRQGSRLKRMIRGNPAMREFTRLQWLQKASVPAPRAIATLVGFRLGAQLGDAVIIEGIEPAIELDQYLNDLQMRADPVPNHLALAHQLRQLVHHLGRAKLGHSDLHLGNILLHEHKLYLLDGYSVRPGGLKLNDVLQLAHSVERHATRTDLQRGWELLGPGGAMPRTNHVARRQWRKFLQRITGENDWFGRIEVEGWNLRFFKRFKHPKRWSQASRLEISASDWERVWPDLLKRIESDQLDVLKHTRSGAVLTGEIILAGRPTSVVVKMPRRKYWYRYVNEIGRGSRAARGWRKAWNLVARDVPTAWPLMYAEQRVMGYVTASAIVYEHVPGPTLAHADLDGMEPAQRAMLFHRVGRLLRRIDDYGLSHFDAKATNWIVAADNKLGPRPVLVDVDGIRFYRWRGRGLE